MISQKHILTLIITSIIITSLGMLFPILGSTFSPYYGSIAKHIVTSGNWSNLVLSGQDWLDKPHLPFWFTAISFKIFGINSFAYILPGFIFNIIGAIYTYKLSKILYNSFTSLLAVLFYFSTIHLMLSSIDVRAEAYLLGEIIPACYYFLRFNQTPLIRYMILGSLFSGLALMTKGIFVLITICSGIICLWIYKKQLKNLINYKWWLCLLLPFIFALPEIIALYIQFDLNPNNHVFNQTHLSGVKWFFWDSQFGRFFNTGQIVTTNPMPYHWLFFIHTFLWAFLPWWPIFFCALAKSIMNIFKTKNNPEADVFLIGSFFITFILFSATSFQVDHYTNIIFPFACIMCAKFINDLFELKQKYFWLVAVEIFFSIIFLFVSVIANYLIFSGTIFTIILILQIVLLVYTIFAQKINQATAIITPPVLSILSLFIMFICINGIGYKHYDAGYNIAKILNTHKSIDVVGYKINNVPMKTLEFFSNNPVEFTDNLPHIDPKHSTYIVTTIDNLADLTKKYKNTKIEATIKGCEIGPYLQNIYDNAKLQQDLKHYVIIWIGE